MEMSTVRQEDREQFWENMCVRTSGDSVIFQRRKSCSIFNAVRWTHWRLQTHTQCVVIHNLWRVMKISRTFAAQNLRIRHFKWARRLCDLKRQTLSWRDRRKGKRCSQTHRLCRLQWWGATYNNKCDPNLSLRSGGTGPVGDQQSKQDSANWRFLLCLLLLVQRHNKGGSAHHSEQGEH